MKHLLRTGSILLALMLFWSLKLPAQAAESDGLQLYVTTTQTSIRVEETVTVIVRADRDVASRGSGMTIYYDAAVLAPDLEASSAAAPFRIDGPVRVAEKTALRISFPPSSQEYTFPVGAALAEIRFKALAVNEKTGISVGAAYLYDATLQEASVTVPEEVSINVAPAKEHISVSGVMLDQTELTLEEGELANLTAKITPIGASDPAVIWSSSNDKVAIVSNGVIKAITAGNTVITATTKDGGFAASCAVTVKPPDAGYTVKLPADTTAIIGETVKIPVTVGNLDGATRYNAFDISFTYDPSVLELVTTQLPDLTLTVSAGKVNVLGYGEERSAGSVPFTLEFRTLRMEKTEVEIQEARVDNSGNATVKNASLATLNHKATAITVTGYPVALPEGFSGADTVAPNTAYTFSVPDDYFRYTVTVTVGGKEVTVTKNGDGSYTIPAELVTGEIVVTATKTGKVFQVTLGTDMRGETTAQHGTDYVATINRDESYRYTVVITIGGKEYTGHQVSGNTYTIPGADITGDIVFAVTKEKIVRPTEPVTRHSVTFTGTGAGAAQGNGTSVIHGKSYTFTLQTQPGYSYQISYKMGGKPAVPLSPNANGAYTIKKVTAPLEIIIEKILDMQVAVHEYVTLDQGAVFLITIAGEPGSDKVFAYNGEAMYFSENYDLWVYPVTVTEELDAQQVEQMVSVTTGTKVVLKKAEYDVDKNGTVDLRDAQMIHDLYNARYKLAEQGAKTFLAADVNMDKKLDVRDVAAVIHQILQN